MKSISSYVIEQMVRLLPTKGFKVSHAMYVNRMNARLNAGEKPYKLRYPLFTVPVIKRQIHGMDYYILNSGEHRNSNKAMYFHGGAFINQPFPFHWKLLNKVAKETGMELWVPIYPKIPFHDAAYAYEELFKLYEVFVKTVEGKIIFMGDSAGGGIVLGLAQIIRDRGLLMQPKELIMISPWLDVSMSLPEISKLEAKDPMLGEESLRVCGIYWAGKQDKYAAMVSPLYGNINGLGNITLFTGTNDILNADARAFYKKVTEQNIVIDYVEKEELGHVYPLLPIKEAKDAVNKIIQICISPVKKRG